MSGREGEEEREGGRERERERERRWGEGEDIITPERHEEGEEDGRLVVEDVAQPRQEAGLTQLPTQERGFMPCLCV